MPQCVSRQCCLRHPRACTPTIRTASIPAATADDETRAARTLRVLANASGDLVISHTTGANLPFARNWWRHLMRVGVHNFALLATDDSAMAALALELPGHAVRCPHSILAPSSASAAHAMRYKSAGWTRLMFAVPRMVAWVLRLGASVLWMDTDIVALANPFLAIQSELRRAPAVGGGASGSTVVLASVDGRVPEENLHECRAAYSLESRWGRSAGGWKLCGGLFYVQPAEATLSFLRDWERRLRAPGAGAKNQPHYNEALRASRERLDVRTLPCDLFPNGYRYASATWRNAQRRAPLLVHNNCAARPRSNACRAPLAAYAPPAVG